MTSTDTIIADRRGETGRRAPAVLQVVPRLEVGGVERGTVEIATALAKGGWKSVVASAGGKMVRELERAGAKHVELPLDSKNPLTMRMNIRRLARLIESERIDIVHARSRAPAWSACLAAARTGRHFVTTFHNAYGAANLLKRRYNSVMARGELVIAISRFVAEHAAATYGVPEARLRVIERGVDLERFNPDRVAAGRMIKLIEAWRLPDGVPVVMLPGRLTRWKGQLVFAEALARLGRRDLRCVFIGDGAPHFRRVLEKHVARLGLEGVCQFVEHCGDMPAAYMLADVVVSPSIRPEGFGRIIAEALAMGRPVIATDHGGAREIVAPQTGWLIEPDDAGALAAALGEALALTPVQRKLIAEDAMTRIRDNFSQERMARRTLAVYEELLFAAAPEAVAP
jgi:glycosyltransferase involved in cell wall biosynthesis